MDDLYSTAYFSNHPCTHGSWMCWGMRSLHLLNPDIFQCMEMKNTPPLYDQSPVLDSDLTSGYLEDALLEVNSKRRRLMMTPDHPHQPSNQNSTTISIPSYWDCSSPDDFDGNGHNLTSSLQSKRSMTISSQFSAGKETLSSSDHITASGTGDKNKKIRRVVYPFALVKPAGFTGHMTLNEINERILMPPTRPVKHPVGDFACRRLVSLDGPGLSGKVVVALTRVQTHGSGTITIIRTKN